MSCTLQKYLVGTRCRSEVWDLYEGGIIQTPDTEDDFYKVRYTDGDEEELDLEEVYECRRYFLNSKKKPSECKTNKYRKGTKVANYFPTGECVDGEIIAVNENNYQVQYDDDTTETMIHEEMKEEVDAYKAAHPEYEIPSAPSTSRKRKRNRSFLSRLLGRNSS
ncbi:predicted protein [Chaetoceros tenuissimus]|uniref:Tudor domain-containing protein n=1 Tax=Chaetoceros tenuissimus TaxID=426638 RepID=A0AAD3HFS3_9STRA|nr:predicted protein [Chaetoceros tenuissimus]